MDRLQKLIPLVGKYYQGEDPAHDWPHIGRVVASARHLCEEEGVEVEPTLAAVYCHDLINLPKNHPDRARASELTADEATPYLREANFREEEIVSIREAIIQHSFTRGERPSSKMAAIVQDADRLDALGAIGVLRCAAVNTLMKSSFYDPADPLAEERSLDDRRYMLDHYFVKLFKLPELMNTEAARAEGERRVKFMRGFVDELMKEGRS